MPSDDAQSGAMRRGGGRMKTLLKPISYLFSAIMKHLIRLAKGSFLVMLALFVTALIIVYMEALCGEFGDCCAWVARIIGLGGFAYWFGIISEDFL